MKKGWWY